MSGREHSRGHTICQEKNQLYKHDSIHHDNIQGAYSMKVLRQHKTPLARQIHESTEMELSTADIIFNSKGGPSIVQC